MSNRFAGKSMNLLKAALVLGMIVLSTYSALDMDVLGHGVRKSAAWKFQATDEIIAILDYLRGYASQDGYVILSDVSIGRIASGRLGLVQQSLEKPYLNLGPGELDKIFWKIVANPSPIHILGLMESYKVQLVFLILDSYWIDVKNAVSLESVESIQWFADRVIQVNGRYETYYIAIFDARPSSWRSVSVLRNEPVGEYGGTWAYGSGILSQYDSAPGWATILLVNSLDKSDRAVIRSSFKVTSSSDIDNHVGVIFSHQSIDSHRYALLREGALNFYERKNSSGVEFPGTVLPSSREYNVTHTLEIRLDGPRVTLVLDDQYVSSFLVGLPSPGPVGLRTHHAAAEFSKLELRYYEVDVPLPQALQTLST